MQKVTGISPTQDHRPIELRHLCVAAYCRISTELEEQTSSIELQERHYSQLIAGNPHWENAGIFLERATDLNLKERSEFHRMIPLLYYAKEVRNDQYDVVVAIPTYITNWTSWKAKPDLCFWALSEPQLENVDLRPYFFVREGAEDYLFDQTQNEVIRQLISKLMGSSMTATSIV